MAREPMTWETPRHLRRTYLKVKQWPLDVRPFEIAELWNDATNPALFRSDAEHAACRRIARACKAQVRKFSLRVKATSSGGMTAV